MKVEIYDPPLCCASGLCGPGIDPVLVKMNSAVLALKKQGVQVERYNLAQQPQAFMANKTITDLLRQKGSKMLPLTLVEGKVFKTGEYPSYEDLCRELGIAPLKKGKPITLQFG